MEAIMGRKEKALLIAIGANLFLVALKFFLAGVSSSPSR
jgi:divalent metal cation (Fe/Co/Zn/Cd) transporter